MLKSVFTFMLTLVLVSGCGPAGEKNLARNFEFEMNFNFPGDPEFVYDHLTGDISDWWDHSFSENPYKLYIEPFPGGGFYEIFDETGDGAKHATVIFAKRGEMLRMEGPLGLSGMALTLVCTYTLNPAGEDGTLLTLNVNGSGDISSDTPGLVKQVWEHFLWEQFNPYISEAYSSRE